MKKALKVVSLSILAALLLVILFVGGSWLYLFLDGKAEFRAQATRLEGLRAATASPSASLARDRAIPDATPFTKLRLLATHNSYRSAGRDIGLFFIGLFQPGEPERLAYSHEPVTAQLDKGVRSFEFDPRTLGERIVLSHVPVVDTRTWEPDFGLALDELVLWSERNPGHLPLVLLLEPKQDYSFIQPGLKPWDAAAFDRLDKLLRDHLGARLFAPADRKGGTWPTVGELRGRVIVVLHENEGYRAIYEKGDPALLGRAMFDCLPDGAPGAVFAILNDPDKEASLIREATARGTIVRTRADADMDIRPELLSAALASGAQIVSTDFPPGHPGPDGYIASLPGGVTADVLP